MIPVLDRDPGIMPVIENDEYFVIHAPRQSGKTTLLRNLTKKINDEGNYYALLCPLSFVANAENRQEAIRFVIQALTHSIKFSELPILNNLTEHLPKFSPDTESVIVLDSIKFICSSLDKELIIFFDEADSIPDTAMLAFLLQIREGFNVREFPGNNAFPKSLALVGLRDLNDYRIRIRPDSETTGEHSPFNIHAPSMSIQNFTKNQIRTLYEQHTEVSGQAFDRNAIDRVWYWTEGQAWLVNALARQIIEVQFENNYTEAVNKSHVDLATKELLLKNEAHFEDLIKRLKETRITRVMTAALSFSDHDFKLITDDDIQYCINLGLLKHGKNGLSDCLPANPIYNEVIVRALSPKIIPDIDTIKKKKWMDGANLNLTGLLQAFQNYWLKNADILFARNQNEKLINEITEQVATVFNISVDMRKEKAAEINEIRNNSFKLVDEAFCVLVLCAFLQRVLNSGADSVIRQYSLGNKLVDICITYNQRAYPIEVKIKGAVTTEQGIRQLSGYIDKCDTSEGWLIEFDRRPGKTLKEKQSFRTYRIGKNKAYVFGC
ncbi:MAG: ATP-binding protein [Deltaproteobacteria bacterium]|jgi:hypothetical protein|nr:ATP-binding protein [Deltaproteobacteria bacterium]